MTVWKNQYFNINVGIKGLFFIHTFDNKYHVINKKDKMHLPAIITFFDLVCEISYCNKNTNAIHRYKYISLITKPLKRNHNLNNYINYTTNSSLKKYYD